MKSATVGQFHELFGKLLIGVDPKEIDFYQIQKFIDKPEDASSLFVSFVNKAKKLPLKNLVIGNRYDNSKNKKYERTVLEKGDFLIFHFRDHTMAAHRPSLKGKNVDLNFNRWAGMLDDKEITDLVELEEILQACSLYASLIGCRAKLQRENAIENGLIYVEMV